VASRLTLIAILAAASAAVLLWGPWRETAPVVSSAADPAHPGAGAPPSNGTATASAPPEAVAARPQAETPPPGLDAAQWATVLAELARHPQPEAERTRLHRYFTWSDAVQRWRGARGDVALARAVDAGLAERLAQGEVSLAEARVLKAALLQTLEPDEARRLAAQQAFDATLPRSAGPTPRETAFLQRQSALVAAWQAQPASQRDPAALQRQLDALRRAQFSEETTR
jgi:hypothetical protein